MHLSIEIIGDAFADIYCYLDADMPKHGGDSRLREPIHTVAGGSGLNTATHLSSLLGQFWRNESADKPRTSTVSLQTVVNENDEHGRLITSHCRLHQLALINRRISSYPSCFFGTDDAAFHSQKGDKSTGHCAVIVSNGDRSFMTHLGCMEDFRGSNILANFLDRDKGNANGAHQHAHIAGYYNIPGFWDGELACKLAEMRVTQAKTRQRMTISLVPQQDASNRWEGGLFDVLKYVDFLILSEVEAQHITRYQCGGNKSDFFHHVADFSFFKDSQTYIIVTLQSEGAVAFYRGEIIHRQRTSPEVDHPIDPTGAGDAFAAGFLHGFLRQHAGCDEISTEAVKEGMCWACAAGTSSIMVRGASVPSRKECIERILNSISEENQTKDKIN
jgi:sugar/nucleoside kinase (ribokinase family)